MRLVNKKALVKLRLKNRGNNQLEKEITSLVDAIENNIWQDPLQLKRDRPDSDSVHSEGFYFFNLLFHRAMILLEFDKNEATVVWVGSHKEYEKTFRNNKNTIRKWLKANDWI
jgi:mRNA interferase HigB